MKKFLVLPLLLLIAGCKPASESPPAADPQPGTPAAAVPQSGKPQVYTANYPLKYFAERLGGSAINVLFPAPADEDPAFWNPDDETIAKYQAANLILMNGASYSKWVDNTTLPDDKVVNTSSAFSKDFIEIQDATTHSHGPGGEHSHSGTAFTTWLDPQQAILQAQEVSTALQALLPAEAKSVQQRFEELKKELETLDNRLLAVSKRIGSAPLVASHPVYQYLARRYSLNLRSVHWEPETVPNNKEMENLVRLLSGHPAKWMIWEGTPAARSVDRLAIVGIQSLVFDPCGNTPESGDFMTVMNANVEALEKAFP
jgi:zinc transport system substrate-binding protein